MIAGQSIDTKPGWSARWRAVMVVSPSPCTKRAAPTTLQQEHHPMTTPMQNGPQNGTPGSTKTIVQVATEAGSFTTLLAAVQAAGLAETLQGAGPFTVFAPNDAAFAKLPAGTLDGLLANKAELASILTYHVVSGRVSAADLMKTNGATPATGQRPDARRRGRGRQGDRERRERAHGRRAGLERRDPHRRRGPAADGRRGARGSLTLIAHT
jgi:uncharacterized surface protein with fasciclin (FAS1) repeats